jgi:hypothetical protein
VARAPGSRLRTDDQTFRTGRNELVTIGVIAGLGERPVAQARIGRVGLSRVTSAALAGHESR